MATYTLRVYSQARRAFREIHCRTLSEAVQLTLGLVASWELIAADGQRISPAFAGAPLGVGEDKDLHVKYYHARRAMICRWVGRVAKQRVLTAREREDLRWVFRRTDHTLWVNSKLVNDACPVLFEICN